MTKKKRHEPIDKARRLGELISLKQPAPVEQPSDKDFAAMLKDIHISIGGRKERSNERSNDKTSDDGKY